MLQSSLKGASCVVSDIFFEVSWISQLVDNDNVPEIITY